MERIVCSEANATNKDPNAKGFFAHFIDEIKEQLKGGQPPKTR
jgi:hypothetical protein